MIAAFCGHKNDMIDISDLMRKQKHEQDHCGYFSAFLNDPTVVYHRAVGDEYDVMNDDGVYMEIGEYGPGKAKAELKKSVEEGFDGGLLEDGVKKLKIMLQRHI